MAFKESIWAQSGRMTFDMRSNSTNLIPELDSTQYYYYCCSEGHPMTHASWSHQKLGRNSVHFLLSFSSLDPDNRSQTESISVKNGSIIFVRIREQIPDGGLLGHFRQQVCGHNISNGMILITLLMNLFIKYFHGRPISQLILIQGVEMSKSQMDQNKFPI